jgi:hypothetical protein
VKKAFLCCFALVISPFLLRAQVANNTSLVGTVTDSTGSVVAGANVIGVNRDTKVSYTGTTNPEGYYSIPFVAPGTYDISFEQAGFKKVVSQGVIVQVNMAVRTDATLAVGNTSTEVTVTADTAALSTDDALLGETISSTKVENTPMNGRHAMDLAATASNIIIGPKTSFTGNPPGENFIGAGTREVTNSLTLDGISIMNNLGSSSPVSPNPDTLDAVQTQNGNYTAQYGGYMGVHINMVSKSGTNDLHGTAYDYVQNDALDAKAWFTAPGKPNPPLRYNQFGFVLGGPVVIPFLYHGKDKTFFLGSYEGTRQLQQVVTPGTVMTNAMKSGDFSAITKQLTDPFTGQAYQNNQIPMSELSSVSAKIFQYLTPPTTSGTSNNFDGNVPNNVTFNQTLDRIDHNIGDKVRLFARYNWQSLNYVAGQIDPTSNGYSPTTDSNLAVGYTHIITPNLVNDARFGYNFLTTDVLNYFAESGIVGAGTALSIPGFTSDTTANNPGIPDINITNYQGAGSDGTNWYQDDRTLHGYDQLSYTHGRHDIMAGVELRKLSLGRAAQNGPRGAFTFSGTYTGNAAADFFLGVAQTVVTPITQIKGSVAEWRDGFFVQDNWQASQKFTLQYGLRYELPTVPYSLNGYARILNADYTALIPATTATSGAGFTPDPGLKFHDPNHTLFAPRLGFAYRATDKIVVRGGAGIYYNPNHLNAFTLATSNYPFASSVTYNATGATPTFTFANPTNGAGSASAIAGTPGTYISAFTDNHYLPTPRLYQWNLDIGNELWKNAALELQYLGSHGIHLDYSLYPNQPLPGPGPVNPRRPYQLFGAIRQIQNAGLSTYNGLTIIFRQRLTHGLDMNLGYTWAKSLDTSNDANGGGTSMIQYDLKADYGSSNWDIRNRFVGTILYDLPTFSRYNYAVRTMLGGWQANAVVTLQSGEPFNVALSTDIANAGNQGMQRPNYVHAGRNTCSTSTLIKYGYNASCIDITAYSTPALYTYGNVHRNDQFGPGLNSTNLSIFKNFPIFGRLTAQFRAEAFNVFNHPSLANPNVTLGASTAGSSTFNPSNFGSVSLVQGSARVLQLAGKINF